MKEARGAILDLPFSRRLEGFAVLTKAASAVKMKPMYKKGLMKKLAEVMLRQGLMEKTASLDEYISDEIAQKCQVINGNHRLYVLLKTLKDEQDRKENLTDRWNIVRTEQTILDERMRFKAGFEKQAFAKHAYWGKEAINDPKGAATKLLSTGKTMGKDFLSGVGIGKGIMPKAFGLMTASDVLSQTSDVMARKRGMTNIKL
jgi:hypothetical protein